MDCERALYIGKFQPFHSGHKTVVEKLDSKYDELVVVIGGAEKSYDPKYLFTAGERIEMINSCVDTSSIHIIPIPDIGNNRIWTEHIEQYTPMYQDVFSNNSLVRSLFKNTDKNVKTIDMVNREKISGTKVREKMREGDKSWKEIVPNNVITVIKSCEGVERIQTLSKQDKDFSKQ